MAYPITAILDDLLLSLEYRSNAVLIAPPGAGKTTNVAPALIDQSWNQGQILLLSPRRLAARMAAHYIAKEMGEDVGHSIGYVTRNESKQSKNNKILVMTEGIFRNKIIEDPMLDGISAVIFDEVHERSLDSDFGLALALEAQKAFRPDLRLIAMSATLDGNRFTSIMGDAPIFESAGQSYPLNIYHIGRRVEKTIEEDLASCVRDIMVDDRYCGDILIFLPGMREIGRLSDILPVSDNLIVHKLHGSINPQDQRIVVKPDPQRRRKIILATNIAETSLTIDGVRIVIDSGLVRRARYDRAANMTRLVTEKSSLASSVQRAGRAARQGEGHAFRLWQEAANGGLMPFDPPEILECDLASLLLDCALWGEYAPQKLPWLDPPPSAGLKQAKKQLQQLGLLDKNGRVNDWGVLAAQLPMPPHLSNMLLIAALNGKAKVGAMLVMLLQEHGLAGRRINLEEGLASVKNERGNRVKTALNMAERWAVRAQRLIQNINAPHKIFPEMHTIGALIALAFPDRIAKRQDSKGENWLGAGGRRYFLDIERASALASANWIAIADVQGSASKTRIASAANIDFDEIETIFSDMISYDIHVTHDMKKDRVDAGYIRSLGAITIAKGDSAKVEQAMIEAAIIGSLRSHGLSFLPWNKASLSLRQRAQYAGINILSDDALLKASDEWLPMLVDGKRRISQIDDVALYQALEMRLGWDALQHINALAPSHYDSPEGKYAIDYDAEGGPAVELRVQALFGLSDHPVVGCDKTPLILSLTSPAGRPIQTTRDLPEFWKGSWHDVAKEMRGRYPKHHWPDNPTVARASLKTKKRQNLK